MNSSPFSLRSKDDRYVGFAEFGDSFKLRSKSLGQRAYWPMLKGDAVTFKVKNQQHLKSGQIIKIRTNENFQFGWQDYNVLGAFSGGVYYWNDYGSKSNWRIEKVVDSSETQIYAGDRIRLWNEHYKQYLAPGDDDYLTTKKESYAWMIVRD